MSTSNPYDYENRAGIIPISWNHFHSLCKGLAAAIAPFQPEIILPIGRAGYYPGTLLAHILLAEVYPVRLSRRVNDVVIHEAPQWLLEPPQLIANRRVLVVDEIASTGETLSMVAEKARSMGAQAVRSAVLYAHAKGADTPDYIGLVSDALLLNPWDREILVNGKFQFHPEYIEALQQQSVAADSSLLIDAPLIEIAKP